MLITTIVFQARYSPWIFIGDMHFMNMLIIFVTYNMYNMMPRVC